MSVMVDIRSVRESFGSLDVLKGIDPTVRVGEVAVVLGPSGSGKSTLPRTINHLGKVDHGAISVDGAPAGYRRSGDKLYEPPEREVLKQRTRIGIVREAADTVVFMDDGRIVEQGAPADVLNAPRHERTRAFLSKVL